MIIDLSRSNESIRNDLVHAFAEKAKRENIDPDEMLRRVIDCVIGNEWVDKQLESSIQADLARLANADPINNPSDESDDEDS